MPEKERPAVGSISWVDLTVPDAESLRQFYSTVVGWTSSDVDMGGYADFTMVTPASGDAVAGVCHARGANESLPSVWLVYIVVDDLEDSLSRVRELGGSVVIDRRTGAGFAVIKDPAGAICALYQRPGE